MGRFSFPRKVSDMLAPLIPMDSRPGSRNAAFPATRWSLVVDLRDDSGTREEALAVLCQTYWFPVYSFVRRSGKNAEDAKDLTQGFFADLLKRDTFSQAEPERGRMRNFLLSAAKRFLAKAHAHDTALKRGGGTGLVAIETEEAEQMYQTHAAHCESPDILFERRWADALFQRALRRLRDHFETTGKAETFDLLKGHLVRGEGDQSYAGAAQALGQTEGAIGVIVHRMRKRLRSLLEEEIRHTLASEDEEEFEDELRHLFAIFQKRSVV